MDQPKMNVLTRSRTVCVRLASQMRVLTIGFAAVAAMLLVTSASLAADSNVPPLPHFTSPVYDETNTLTAAEKSDLERKLLAFEDSTSTQIVIAILATTNGEPASDFAIRLAEANKIGQAKKNNGALIFIAKNDHKAFIATGYGVESVLTDAALSMIYQNELRPALQQGQFYQGLDKTLASIQLLVAGEYHADKKVEAKRNAPTGRGTLFFIILIVIAFIVLRGLLGTGIRRTVVGSGGAGSGCLGGIMQGLFWSSIFNSGRGGGGMFGGGGGGFGGGGGGWSGGGGSFGGGGAGGDW
jgi:uncharacterized protein